MGQKTIVKNYSFLSLKQMFDADAALDGKPIDFKVFQSCLGLGFNFIEISLFLINF